MSDFYDIDRSMKMNFIHELEILGLNGRQAKVYFALLQLGSASAVELAKFTTYKHPTVYDVLDVLKEKGLVSESLREGKKRFAAEAPEALQQIEDRRQYALDAILPDLKSLYHAQGSRPRIRFFDGADGIRRVNEELLNVKSKEYFYFGSVQEMYESCGESYLREFYRRRIERGIWSNAIRNPGGEMDIDYMRPGDHNLRRVRYLPRPIDHDIAGLYLYDNTVAIHSTLKETYGMVIESDELFRLLKSLWLYLWEVCPAPASRP